MTERLVISQKLAPGDAVVLTALVRDLSLAYPGRFEVAVDTHAAALWRNNPHVARVGEPGWPDARRVTSRYRDGILRQARETVHFLAWLHRDFERQTGVPVPVTAARGDLHLGPDEARPRGRPYWLLSAGGKYDVTAKVWDATRWQAVVDALTALGLDVVQVGAARPDHWHPDLARVVDLRGRTSLRDVVALAAGADGVLCGVSFPMHLAAALERPCVVVAGGREAWWWEAYVRENRGFGSAPPVRVPHRYLHTIGLLDCCRSHGCWRRKVGADAGGDASACLRPTPAPLQWVPACLALITPAMVVEAALGYYADGTLEQP